MHRRLVLSAILATLIAGGATPVLGQSDLAAQLVGKWEGTQYQTIKGGSRGSDADDLFCDAAGG